MTNRRWMTLPRTCLAMVHTAPRKLEPRDLPLPAIDADTALLRVEACGICGSDYEQYEGVLRSPMPAVPGHEPLGTIAAIGDRAALPLGSRRRRPRGGRDHALVPLLRRMPRRPLPPLRAAADLLLHPARRAAGTLGRLRRVHVPRRQRHRAPHRSHAGGADRGALQPVGRRLPLGGRGAGHRSRRPPCSSSAPGSAASRR